MTDGNALKLFSYGIYFLGCKKGGDVNSMVASWVTQVSFEPRRVAVGVKKTRRSHDMIKDGGVFTLCVLDKNQKNDLDKFKSSENVEWEFRETGAPILKDCVAYVECRVVRAVDAGDHTLFIGDVVAEGVGGGAEKKSCAIEIVLAVYDEYRFDIPYLPNMFEKQMLKLIVEIAIDGIVEILNRHGIFVHGAESAETEAPAG